MTTPETPEGSATPREIFGDAHELLDELRADADEQAERTEANRSFWRELPILVAIALIVAVVIKIFIIQAFWIPSSSMEDTLQINDRVMVSKLSYAFGREPRRGDVVVFDDPRGERANESVIRSVFRNIAESVGLSTPRSEFIKRVIAREGETIEIRDNQVLVDGIALDEPYVAPGSRMPEYGPITIKEDFVFVMGDNRNASQDSRVFGPIPNGDIVGRAVIILWPPSRWSGL